MLTVVARAQAREDLNELADHLAMDSIDVAERFIAAVESAFAFLAETPGAGARREYVSPALSGLRMWSIHGFEKHLIFYREHDNALDVIRVLHSARDIEAIFEV